MAVTGSSNYTGIMGINDGVVILDGSFDSTASIVIGANGVLAGTGTAAGVVIVAGTLEPGHSPGELTTGGQAWLEDGNYNWQLLDATGTAGEDFDLVNIQGQLNLTNLVEGDFNINLWTLSDPNTSGDALNFNDALNQSWTLATTTAGIVGFNADYFTIHTGAFNGTDGFANTLAGDFSVSVDGNNLMLNYTVIPEPSALLLLTGSLLAFAARSRKRARR
jgi:hypothetical protein